MGDRCERGRNETRLTQWLFVTPPPKLDFALVNQLLGEVGATRAALATDVEALRAAPRAIPHQLLGDLTGPEWVRFARVRTAHHLVILDEVLTAAPS